jgi:hypothetical protein
MTVEGFKGYREGQDILQIPPDYLTYPSKNCLTYKGKVVSRLGIKNDGVAHTEDTAVHSEYVWKKSPSGTKSLRVWGTKLQLKIRGNWITIYDGFDASTGRVRFASWIDTNGAIIKNRLFMVDGSDNIYEWNGGVATIDAPVGGDSAKRVRISDTKTLLQLGFDSGASPTQNVKLVSMTGDVVDDINDYTYTDTLSNNSYLDLVEDTSPLPTAGDLLIAQVIKHTNKLTGIDKDEIYNYKNHLFVANLDSGRIYNSDAITKLDFTIPMTTSAVTAGLLDLEGNFTAMIERKGVLWISTVDDWYKVTKAVEENQYGYWTTVEKFEMAESIGAKPFAVAIQKGDVIFMAQDKRIRRIITLEILGIDDIELISDQIEGLLDRMEMEDVRIYYYQRYIYVISVTEGIMLMLDVLAGEYMPPQYMGISCISIIDGVLFGHSNTRNESFFLFNGRNDLGGQIEVTIAGGFSRGKKAYDQKKHSQFGLHARATVTTRCDLEYQYEEFGAGVLKPAEFVVGDITTYDIDNDVSFGAHPFGTHSFAGVDDEADSSLKGFYLFDVQDMVSWFDFRPVFNISGTDIEFHLLSWDIDEEVSDDNIPPELFINRE